MKTYHIPKTGEIYEVSEEATKEDNNFDMDSNTSDVLACGYRYNSKYFSIIGKKYLTEDI